QSAAPCSGDPWRLFARDKGEGRFPWAYDVYLSVFSMVADAPRGQVGSAKFKVQSSKLKRSFKLPGTNLSWARPRTHLNLLHFREDSCPSPRPSPRAAKGSTAK